MILPHEFDVMCLWVGRTVTWAALAVGAVLVLWLALALFGQGVSRVLRQFGAYHKIVQYAWLSAEQKKALAEIAKDNPLFRCACGHGRHSHLGELGRCVACNCPSWDRKRR